MAFFEYSGRRGRRRSPSRPASPTHGRSSSTTCRSTCPTSTRSSDAAARLKEHGCEVTDVVDHGFMRSIYFTDPNGIALEASWWVIDATGRQADYGDDRALPDPDPVPGRPGAG